MTQIIKTASAQLAAKFNVAPTVTEKILAAFGGTAKLIKQYEQEYFDTFNGITEFNEQVCKDAKSLRLKFQKARTSSESIRKDIKADVLLQSKVIDGAGNIFKLQIIEREKELKDIEEHFERIEAEKLEKIKNEREENC